MAGDPRVQRLLERILETNESPEVVCRDTPELLDEVRAEWQKVRPLRDELAALFPDPDDAAAIVATSTDPVVVPGYELDGVLGRGGMGIVHRARQLGLNRIVALKMMLAGAHATPNQLARFRREAELVASLRHPNIVQVYDVGEVDGVAWFTMEYVAGGTLAARMGQHVTARDAATLVATLARAIQSAHESGIVHRDLKPSNVLLTADGVPKISDFGLARSASHATMLTLGGALGTPNYMAPEQVAHDREVGPTADVHALGAILYELLAGQPPFRGQTVAATLHQVLEVDPTPPSRLSSRVPRDLETITLKCLAKQPQHRYQHAAELADDLQRFLRHEPVHARRVGLAGRGLRWSRRHPAAATLVALLVGSLGWTIGDTIHSHSVAAQEREANARWAAVLGRVREALSATDLTNAASLLAELPDGLPADLRAEAATARTDVQLVRALEGIRMQRSAIVGGRFDLDGNRTRADQAYQREFAETELDVLASPTAQVVQRLDGSPIRRALVAAIDDWALCTEDPSRRATLLAVTRRCDPDPDGWRDRVRDPARCADGKALQALADEAPLTEASVQLLVGLGEQLARSGMDARPFLERVQQAFPADFWSNYLLGETLRAEQPAEAIRYFQAAVAIRPQAVMARLGLGYSLLYAGRAHEALGSYRLAIELDGEVADAHAQLAMCLHQTGDREAAVAAYGVAIRLAPELSHVHQNLGNVLGELGRFDEALAEYREAARLEPENPTPNYSVAVCLYAMGRFDEGLAAAQHVVELRSDQGTRFHLGLSYAALGRLDEAETEFRGSLAIDPDFEHSLNGLRSLLLRRGRHEEALELWQATLARNTTDHGTRDGYAELCIYLGRADDYVRACAELLTRFGNADDPHVWERTGRACLLAPGPGRELQERAADLVARAVHADSSRYAPWAKPYFQLSLAIAEHRLGRFEQALELLRGDAAAVLWPAPMLVFAMGRHHGGDAAAARTALTDALLGFDWRPERAIDREAWIYHVLRREAAALLVPGLDALLAGDRAPADRCERAAMVAEYAATGRFAAAAETYEQLFANEPSRAGSTGRRHCYIAACVAASGITDTADGERCRELARRWLRADLEDWQRAIEASPSRRGELAACLATWQQEPALAPLRDADRLSRSTPAEREACEQLWRDVARLAATVAGDVGR